MPKHRAAKSKQSETTSASTPAKRRSGRQSAAAASATAKCGGVSTTAAATAAAVAATAVGSDSCDGGGRGAWTAEKSLSELRSVYVANANPGYAQSVKQYMRNQFEFYGIRAPRRRQLNAEVWQTINISAWSGVHVHSLIRLLWNQTEREYQQFALDLAAKHPDKVLFDYDHAVKLFLDMITKKSWWDTVDVIAPLVGTLVTRNPGRGRALMDDWIKHDYLWVRRVAILHQLYFKKDCREDILFRYCLARSHETDFFIRKAIGWALRQHAHVHPSAVKQFVISNEAKLSSLSKKEALKHLGGWPQKKAT